MDTLDAVYLIHFRPIFPWYTPEDKGIFRGHKMVPLVRNWVNDFIEIHLIANLTQLEPSSINESCDAICTQNQALEKSLV